MPTHRYPTRQSSKPIKYYDGDSSSDYDDGPPSSTKSAIKSRAPSDTHVHISSAVPHTYSLPTYSGDPKRHDDPQLPSPYSCPDTWGWGHYDGQSGLRIPLQQSQKSLPKFETHRTVLVSLNEQLNTSANEPWSSPSAYSTHSLSTIQEANDSGYISAEAERGFGKGTEKGVKEEVEVEEKSLVFAWDRFKDPGKKRGRAYRVDGEGDCFMSGV
jgi:hypothetical protein